MVVWSADRDPVVWSADRDPETHIYHLLYPEFMPRNPVAVYYTKPPGNKPIPAAYVDREKASVCSGLDGVIERKVLWFAIFR